VRREKGSIVRNCTGALATSDRCDVSYLRLCLTLNASNAISGASHSSRVRPSDSDQDLSDSLHPRVPLYLIESETGLCDVDKSESGRRGVHVAFARGQKLARLSVRQPSGA
jgi:hypothetical protein